MVGSGAGNDHAARERHEGRRLGRMRTCGSGSAIGGSRAWRTALAAVVAVAVWPSAAHSDPGTYSVWSCRGPDGAPLTAAAFEPGSANAAPGDVVVSDSCAHGGRLTLALAQDRAFAAPVVGTATFAAAAGTRIVGYELWRSLAVAAPRWIVGNYDFGAALTEDGSAYGCATYGADCHERGDPGEPLAAENRQGERRAPLATVGLRVWCDWDRCGEPSGTPARLDLYGSRVDLVDFVPPAVPQLSGTLASGGLLSGAAALVVSAADQGSGVRSVSMAIDGGPEQTLAPDASSCHQPYALPQPCPATLMRTFTVQTAGLQDGAHLAAGTVVDAGGNARPWSVRFATHNATVSGSPPEPALQLRLARTRVNHAPGRAATLRGRLLTPAGAPVAGARLGVTSIDLGVADERSRELRPVTTDAEGAFTVKLRRDGAQRITIAFSPRPGVLTAQASATVRSRLALRLASSKRLLIKGRSMTLRGRLAGAGASAKGALVQIEAIVNGRWSPVGRARARGDGSFRWRYRFVHLSRDTIFTFRAVVERVPGWSWPTERSGGLGVRVNVP
jgi:hypothetical protein